MMMMMRGDWVVVLPRAPHESEQDDEQASGVSPFWRQLGSAKELTLNKFEYRALTTTGN